MTVNISNVELGSDTFGNWLSKTNQVIEAIRTKAVTTDNPVTGNVVIQGTTTTTNLEANTITANSIYVGNSHVWHSGNGGIGSGLDADLLDGQQSSYYTNVPARLGYTPLDSALFTGPTIISLIWAVDGAGSGIDADLLDGFEGSSYRDASNLSTGVLPSGRLANGVYTVSSLTATTLAAANASFSGTLTSNNASFSNVTATLYQGNGASLTSVNAALLEGKAASEFANSAHTHDFSTIANTTQVVRYDTSGAFTKPQRIAAETLTDGGTITPNLNNANVFRVTIGGNRTIANPSNIASALNQEVVIYVKQDGSGNRTLSWGSQWKFPGGVAPTLSTAAGAIDMITGFVYSSTQVLCNGIIRDIK